MQIEKLVASKIIPQLLKLPRRLSEMTEEQIQLVELTCVRARIDPKIKRHVTNKLENAHLPTALKLTKATTLGYWKYLGVTLVDDEIWTKLDNLYFIEDIRLDPETRGFEHLRRTVDPYRICTEAYLKGEYIPLRVFKHKPALAYHAGIAKQVTEFLSFESNYIDEQYTGEMDYHNTPPPKGIPKVGSNVSFTFEEFKALAPQRLSELPVDIKDFVKEYGEVRIVDEANKPSKTGSSYVIYVPKKNLDVVFEKCTQLVIARNHFYDDEGFFTCVKPAKLNSISPIDRNEAAQVFADTMVRLYKKINDGNIDFDYRTMLVVVKEYIDTVKSILEKLDSEGILKDAPRVGVMITAFKNQKAETRRARGNKDYTGRFTYPVEYAWFLHQGIYLTKDRSKEE